MRNGSTFHPREEPKGQPSSPQVSASEQLMALDCALSAVMDPSSKIMSSPPTEQRGCTFCLTVVLSQTGCFPQVFEGFLKTRIPELNGEAPPRNLEESRGQIVTGGREMDCFHEKWRLVPKMGHPLFTTQIYILSPQYPPAPSLHCLHLGEVESQETYRVSCD